MFSASLGRPRWESFNALHDAKEINFVAVHDERTGTHMADGYACASGETGVVLAGQARAKELVVEPARAGERRGQAAAFLSKKQDTALLLLNGLQHAARRVVLTRPLTESKK